MKKTRSERDSFMTDYLIRKEGERKIAEREESQKHASVYTNNEKLKPRPTPPTKND